jgi:hypothetical protein
MMRVNLLDSKFKDSWFYHHHGQRNDTIKNAQRAADTTGQAQKVWNMCQDDPVLDWTCEPNPRKMRAYGRT